MSSEITVGDGRRLAVAIRNVSRRPADPTTLTLRVTKPGQTPVVYTYPDDAEIVKDEVGSYHMDLTLDVDGIWSYRWIGTGAAAFNKGRSFYVGAA